MKKFLIISYLIAIKHGYRWSDRHRKNSINAMYGYSKRVIYGDEK